MTSQATSSYAATDSKTWAICAHLGVILNLFVLPIAGVVIPYVIYATKNPENEFVREHARAAFNFQLSAAVFVVTMAFVGLIGFVLIAWGASTDFPLMGIVGTILGITGVASAFLLSVFALVDGLINALRASDGQGPEYHLAAYKFIK